MKLNFNLRRISALSILDSLIEFIYLAVIFTIPLWFSYWFPTYNIFEFNKIVLFKILIWILLFLTLIKIIFYRLQFDISPNKFFKKYWLVPTILIAGLSLNLIVSLNPALSFYGTIERQEGLASYLFYFLWFILISFNVLSGCNREALTSSPINKKINRIVAAVVLSGFLVALYGVLQIMKIDFVSWPEAPYLTHRTISSLGQPNFLASWLLLVIPLSIYLFSISRRILVKFIWLCAAALQLLCLFFTGSRGGLAALVFAAFIFLVYLLISAAWTRRKKLLVGLIFITLTIFSLWFLDYFSGGRLRELKNSDYGSLGARTNFYQAAAEAIMIRPIFGYGLENSQEVFIQYYNTDWGVYGNVNQSTDRAHNLFLDILLTTGSIGLLLFMIFYYFFFDLARTNLKQKKMPHLSLAIALGAAAYLFSLLFSFTIVTGEIYFWLFLALLIIANASETFIVRARMGGDKFKAGGNKSDISIRVIIILLLAIVTAWQIGRILKTLAADYYFNRVDIYLARGDYASALIAFDSLSYYRINPVSGWSYDYFLGEKLTNIYPSLTDPALQSAFEKKLTALEKYLPLGGYQDLLTRAEISGVLGDFSAGRDYIAQVITLTPHWPLAYLNAGQLAASAGDFQEALFDYHLAALNLPSVSDPRLNDEHRQRVLDSQYLINDRIGDIYVKQQNYPAAEKYYQLAYASDPADFTLLKKISDAYYYRGDLKNAIKYSAHGLARNPGDYNWSLALGILYHESGDKRQALDYIRQAIRLAPGISDLKILEKEYSK